MSQAVKSMSDYKLTGISSCSNHDGSQWCPSIDGPPQVTIPKNSGNEHNGAIHDWVHVVAVNRTWLDTLVVYYFQGPFDPGVRLRVPDAGAFTHFGWSNQNQNQN